MEDGTVEVLEEATSIVTEISLSEPDVSVELVDSLTTIPSAFAAGDTTATSTATASVDETILTGLLTIGAGGIDLRWHVGIPAVN